MKGLNFIHLREKGADGRALTHGGVTIAYAEITDETLAISIAMCNEKDNFCRRIGRSISSGRLAKGIWTKTIPLDPGHDYTNQERYALVRDQFLRPVFSDHPLNAPERVNAVDVLSA